MNDGQIKTFVQELVSELAGIESVWLFGSRANESFRPDSDWDLMVFADQEAFAALRRQNQLKNEYIDVIIVIDMETFSEPWPENTSNCKSGDFSTWEWERYTPDLAKYTSVKYLSDDWFKSGQSEIKRLVAKRIWP
ncbi:MULTISPECIES: nucleotidyltransferase domain-containing protein [Methylomonas]|uniref:Polymerase beta nucleotidyltransferase domain-containing protein n=1 Tax=Methylomonas koyamae TaxID=702114 RepID=A0A177P6U0_9GAMM|nr:nucleotidyltransferase domain-containing protein [Methylomonas koyamae]OAI25163.1 hypothetical protein A1355_19850 [Methylomonas koyamae]